MSTQTRRSFLRRSAAAGAGFAVCGAKSYARIVGANETIRVAVCGIKGRGAAHIDGFAEIPNVEVAALVDVDSTQFGQRLEQLEKMGYRRPGCVRDVREVLDDDSIDVISIATPNHTHALYTVWGCQVGKDVYVEKPGDRPLLGGSLSSGKHLVSTGTCGAV